MKVDSSPDSYIGSVAGGPQKAAATPPVGADSAGAAATAGAAASAKPQAGVTVTLSSSASQALSGAGTAGSDSAVFNTEKVEAMKAAIANGSFQVNAEAIADKMLSNAAEMLGGSRG
jgi:negative regulator of flagellin synthesis FlgM